MRRMAATAPVRWRVLSRGAVAAVLVITVFAGCSGGDSGVDPPRSGTVSPSVSASPSTSQPAATPIPSGVTADYIPASDKRPAANVPVPVLPDAAKEFSKEGLEEFTRYWYSTLGYAFETGDTGPMLAITDPGCQTCQAMNEAVVDGHADGSWIEGGQMNVLFTQGNMHQAPDGTYQTIATVMQQNVKYYGPDKVLIEDMGINKAVDDIVISNYVNGHWTAKTVEHLMGSEGE